MKSKRKRRHDQCSAAPYSSQGHNYADIRGRNYADITGLNYADTGSMGHNYGDSMGQNYSNIRGHNYGDSMGHNYSDTDSMGHNYVDSTGQNNGNIRGHNCVDSTGQNNGNIRGHNYGNIRGHNYVDSMGQNNSNIRGHNYGDSMGQNNGNIWGHNYGDSVGHNYGNFSSTYSYNRGHSYSDIRGHNHSDTKGHNFDDINGQCYGDCSSALPNSGVCNDSNISGHNYGDSSSSCPDSRGYSYGDTSGHNFIDSRGHNFGESNSFCPNSREHGYGEHNFTDNSGHDYDDSRSVKDSKGHNHDDSGVFNYDNNWGQSHGDNSFVELSKGHNYVESKGSKVYDENRGHNYDDSREVICSDSRGHAQGDSRFVVYTARAHSHEEKSRLQKEDRLCPSTAPLCPPPPPTLAGCSVSHSDHSWGVVENSVMTNPGLCQGSSYEKLSNPTALSSQPSKDQVHGCSQSVSGTAKGSEAASSVLDSTEPEVTCTSLESSLNDTQSQSSVVDTKLKNPINNDSTECIDLTVCDSETELAAVKSQIGKLIARKSEVCSKEEWKEHKSCPKKQRKLLRKKVKEKKRSERQSQSTTSDELSLLLQKNESQGEHYGGDQFTQKELADQSSKLAEARVKIRDRLDVVFGQLDMLSRERGRTGARKKAFKNLKKEKNDLQSKLGQIKKAQGKLGDSSAWCRMVVDPFCELSKLAKVVGAWRQGKLSPGLHPQEDPHLHQDPHLQEDPCLKKNTSDLQGESCLGEEMCETKHEALQTGRKAQEDETQSVGQDTMKNTPQIKQEEEIAVSGNQPTEQIINEVRVVGTSQVIEEVTEVDTSQVQEEVIVISDSDIDEDNRHSPVYQAKKHLTARSLSEQRQVQSENLQKLSREIDQIIVNSSPMTNVNKSYFFLAGLAEVLLAQQRRHSNQHYLSHEVNPVERSAGHGRGQQTDEEQRRHLTQDKVSHSRVTNWPKKPSPCCLLIAKIVSKFKPTPEPS